MGLDDTAALDAPPVVAVAAVAAVEGDWAGFAAAWAPIQDRLFRIALLIARQRSDAEDAVADAMAATFVPWRNGRVQSLEGYARTAVVNRLTGRGRRRMVAERHARHPFRR